MNQWNSWLGSPSGGREQVAAGVAVEHALVDVHRAAGLAGHRLGHEGGVDAVLEGGLAQRALEQEGLVGELERVAVVEVDLHLRGAGLVGQRVDVDLLRLAPVVDVLEDRVELVDRVDAEATGAPVSWRRERPIGGTSG